MAPSNADWLTQLTSATEVVQLSHPLDASCPRGSIHPPFAYRIIGWHEEEPPLPGTAPDPRVSNANDAISMGTHVGTHVDGLTHCAWESKLADGTPVTPGHGPVELRSGDSLKPLIARGVLLDFVAFLGQEPVPGDYAITCDALEKCANHLGVTIETGDVVLIRTGWDTLWSDARRYLEPPFPGPDAGAALRLAQAGVLATGSDTLAYEAVPGAPPLAVHAELIAKRGIFILECLNLVELSRRRQYTFGFVALPLRIPGGTGSPVAPVAIVTRPAA